MRQHIGVSLSGGGHRATVWALGALLYLVDAGKNREVCGISSVSGGSITNGVVAHEVDYAATGPEEFDRRVSPLAQHVADEGLFFWGRATNGYVMSVFVLASLGVVTLVSGVVLVALRGLDPVSGLVLLAAAAILVVTAWWFERRSLVVEGALARTHFGGPGPATRLADVDRSVDHIFCATELQSGRHVYFSPRFLYSWALGTGVPADLTLATAVQASACLPGAFATRRLPTAPYGFSGGRQADVDDMVLADGGVYDNMADQWFDGLADRLKRLPELPVRGCNVDEIIVVNSSTPVPWRSVRRSRLILASELAILKRVNDVMYQVTTQRRRSALVRQWETAAGMSSGVVGALVHIAQSPYRTADFYRMQPGPGVRASRAEAVLRLLGDDADSRARWEARAEASSAVPTVLRRLGEQTTVNLMEHAYVLAMCNLHIILGYPLLALPSRDRFTRLIRGVEPTLASYPACGATEPAPSDADATGREAAT